MNKTKTLIQGVGINDVPLPTYTTDESGRKVMCPYYRRWTNMLARCYSSRQPEYDQCTVHPDWHYFSNFKAWMMSQKDWEGKALDKDLIDPSNKVYGPEHCVFITQEVNALFTGGRIGRELPKGVTAKGGKYRASVKLSSGVVMSNWVSDIATALVLYIELKVRRVLELMPKVDNFRVRKALHNWILENG